MKSGFLIFFRLLGATYFCSRGTPGRLTLKRFCVMSAFLPILFMVQLMHWVGFLLDDIFFRGYRNIEVKEPLFIVGIPRSGTTLLQRVVAGDTERFTSFTLWELLFAPSIIERKFWLGLGKLDRLIGKPGARLIAFIERNAFAQLDAIHRISLKAPEEDYFVLVPILACFILILPFPFSQELWRIAYFDQAMPQKDKQRIMAFYKACLQRHLYVRGAEKQLLSKNPSFSGMIESLDETFPDCKIVGCIRDPLEAIPSLISSMMSGARIFDNDPQGHGFRDQLLEMLKYFYEHLTHQLPKMPDERHAFVTLNELKERLGDTVRQIYDKLGWTMSPAFQTFLQMEDERARKYSSKHKYTLEMFELEPDDISREFAYVYERFDFDVA